MFLRFSIVLKLKFSLVRSRAYVLGWMLSALQCIKYYSVMYLMFVLQHSITYCVYCSMCVRRGGVLYKFVFLKIIWPFILSSGAVFACVSKKRSIFSQRWKKVLVVEWFGISDVFGFIPWNKNINVLPEYNECGSQLFGRN